MPSHKRSGLNTCMDHWQSYIRASWELVLEAEGRSHEYLDEGIESFLVHTMARNFENLSLWEKPIGVTMLEAKHMPGQKRKETMRRVGEECLIIDAWQLKQRRWPTPTYFREMGSMAFGFAAISTRPPDDLLDQVGNNFGRLSRVLRTVRDLGNS